jgi:hypothetical protein
LIPGWITQPGIFGLCLFFEPRSDRAWLYAESIAVLPPEKLRLFFESVTQQNFQKFLKLLQAISAVYS